MCVLVGLCWVRRQTETYTHKQTHTLSNHCFQIHSSHTCVHTHTHTTHTHTHTHTGLNHWFLNQIPDGVPRDVHTWGLAPSSKLLTLINLLHLYQSSITQRVVLREALRLAPGLRDTPAKLRLTGRLCEGTYLPERLTDPDTGRAKRPDLNTQRAVSVLTDSGRSLQQDAIPHADWQCVRSLPQN